MFRGRRGVCHEHRNNSMGWQWVAGCGCGVDAAPYYRVFNPNTQTRRFDKDMTNVSKDMDIMLLLLLSAWAIRLAFHITCFVALPISSDLGAEIPLSSIRWKGSL